MRPCSFRYFFYALRHIFMYETKFDIVAFRFARETFCCVSTLVFSLSRLLIDSRFQPCHCPILIVVLGRVELPTSTLSV